MTRIWGHAEDREGRLPFSWIADHEIEPSADDGMCTGCGGRIALVGITTWDCGCIQAIAEGVVIRACEIHRNGASGPAAGA